MTGCTAGREFLVEFGYAETDTIAGDENSVADAEHVLLNARLALERERGRPAGT